MCLCQWSVCEQIIPIIRAWKKLTLVNILVHELKGLESRLVNVRGSTLHLSLRALNTHSSFGQHSHHGLGEGWHTAPPAPSTDSPLCIAGLPDTLTHDTTSFQDISETKLIFWRESERTEWWKGIKERTVNASNNEEPVNESTVYMYVCKSLFVWCILRPSTHS